MHLVIMGGAERILPDHRVGDIYITSIPVIIKAAQFQNFSAKKKKKTKITCLPQLDAYNAVLQGEIRPLVW